MRNVRSENSGIVKIPVLRLLLLVSGWLLVVMALIGIILPLVPTTPLLLLAAICFAKSSARFYNWLYANRIFGKYLLDYKERKGIPAHVKVWSLLFLWISLIVSAYLLPFLWVRILLLVVGTAVTTHLLLIREKRS